MSRVALFFVQNSVINFSESVRDTDGQFSVSQKLAFRFFDPYLTHDSSRPSYCSVASQIKVANPRNFHV